MQTRGRRGIISSTFIYGSYNRNLTKYPRDDFCLRNFRGLRIDSNLSFLSLGSIIDKRLLNEKQNYHISSSKTNEFDENVTVVEDIEGKFVNYHRFPRIYTPSNRNRLERSTSHVNLDENQIHYLTSVMRLRPNHDYIRIFNGKDGEWLAKLKFKGSLSETENEKKYKIKKTKVKVNDIEVVLEQKLRNQFEEPKVSICFAPLKNKDRVRFLLEKATELGVSKIFPIITKHTDIPFNSASKMLDKMYANMIEAAEQCERLSIPQIYPLQTYSEFTSSWINNDNKYEHNNEYFDDNNVENATNTSSPKKVILACRERLQDRLALQSELAVVKPNQTLTTITEPKDLISFFQAQDKNCFFLIGPEGGFTNDEWSLLENLINEQSVQKGCTSHQIKYISLSPNILRAETAVISALSLWAYNTQNK